MNTKVITVGGTKGGAGKSTVAQSIASYIFLKKTKSIFLLDIDPQRTTATWCDERSQNESLPHIPYAYEGNDVDVAIDNLRDRYEYIIIDAGGFDSEIQRHALLYSDIAILPIRPKRRDLRSLAAVDAVISAVKSAGSSVRPFVVMAQCPSLPSQMDRILFAKDICKTFDFEVLDANIYNRNVYDDAEWEGGSIFEVEKGKRDPKAEKEITEVAEFVINARAK